MSKYKEMVKGWKPEKPEGGIRHQVGGRVNGLLGRNKSSEEAASDHVARPISQLRDPSSFAPPPKRTGSGLIPAPPPTSTPRKVVTAPSKYQDPRAPPVEAPVYEKQPPNAYYQEEEQEPEEERPPQQYRMNTTGVSTEGLPPPPSYRAATGGGPPSLPPRLPPRTNSASPARTPTAVSPASTGNSGYLNQSAANRLGAAGVSVSALGIGRSSPANASSPGPPQPPRPNASPASHMNELQNRFSKLGTSSASSSPAPPAEGTTWAQKQTALKTASSFQKDPSSVSFSDARTAATTANNFRQRHGEQVASGMKSANNLNQRYGVMDKVGGVASSQGHGAASPAPSPPVAGLAGKKKPPPPPPKKKPGLAGAPTSGAPVDGDGPPPVPLSTRPQF